MTAPVAADLLAAGEWESALLVGLAQLLEDHIPGWTYDAETVGDVQIATGQAPDKPDRVVTIDTYGVYDNPTIALTDVYVQLRFRSRPDHPLDPKGMASKAAGVLSGRTDSVIGGLFCPTIYRDTSAQLGRNATRRWERTDNYTITVDLPSTGNRE